MWTKTDWDHRRKVKEAMEKHGNEINSPWIEVYDPGEKGFYYWHQETHETTWEQPKGYKMSCDDSIMSSAIRIQNFWRIVLARIRTKIRKTVFDMNVQLCYRNDSLGQAL